MKKNKKKFILKTLVCFIIFTSVISNGCKIVGALSKSEEIVGLNNVSSEEYEVYPMPDESVPESLEYEVFIGEANEKSFVYYSKPPKYDSEDPKSQNGTKKDGADYYRTNNITQNWTSVSIANKTKVTVKKKTSFTSVKVLPSQYGITPQVNKDHTEVTFYLEPTQKAFVEFDNKLIDRIYIFADPMEKKEDVPNKNDSNVFVVGSAKEDTPTYGEEKGCLDGLTSEHTVLYFPAGVYDIESYGEMIESPEDNNGFTEEARVGYRSAWVVPKHITHIYIEGGGVVQGGFYIGHNNVKVNGRGIISGQTLVYHQLNLLEYASGTTGGYVEGITLSDGVHFSLRGWGAKYNGENFKVIANWRYNNDGINVPQNATIKNCYLSGNDDTVKFYFGGSTLENCVIGQMINGAVFQFGWGYRQVSDINVKNVYVVHYDGESKNQNIGVINFRPRGEQNGYPTPDKNGVIKNYVAENITFDGLYMNNSIPRFISLGLPEYQIFRNITIKNTDIESFSAAETSKNYIKGSTDYSAKGNGLAENIAFEDLKVGGEYITKDNYLTVGNFETFDPEIVKNVLFTKNQLDNGNESVIGKEFVVNGDFEEGDLSSTNIKFQIPAWTKVLETESGTMSLKTNTEFSNKWIGFRKNINTRNILSQEILDVPKGIYTLKAKTSGEKCNSANIKIYKRYNDGSESLIKTMELPQSESSDFVLSKEEGIFIDSEKIRIEIEINALENKTYKVDDVSLKDSLDDPNKEDVNKDGKIDIIDLTIVASKYSTVLNQAGYDTKSDINKDSIIDLFDLTRVAARFDLQILVPSTSEWKELL